MKNTEDMISEARDMIANRRMTWPHWIGLPHLVREVVRDESELCPELIGKEGCRVEATQYGERKRFQVGMSTGWRPCHIALHNRRCMGGGLVKRGTLSDVVTIRRIR